MRTHSAFGGEKLLLRKHGSTTCAGSTRGEFFVRVCLFLSERFGQVTMERAKLLPNVSDFNPQQSVMSTKTLPRINNRGRKGSDAWRERTTKNAKRGKRGEFEKK